MIKTLSISIVFTVIIVSISCGGAGNVSNSSSNASNSNISSTTESVPTSPQQYVNPIPEFPWPPPEPSAYAEVPKKYLLVRQCRTFLKDVAERLKNAFDRAGYTEKSWYSIPGGFALVSRLEQFRPDGASMDDQDRWSVRNVPSRIRSIRDYIDSLFSARPGLYRAIVFLITNNPFVKDNSEVTREQAMDWLRGGMNTIPPTISSLEFTDDYTCTALIYEFEQSTPDHVAFLKRPSKFTGLTHLEKCKILDSLRRQSP